MKCLRFIAAAALAAAVLAVPVATAAAQAHAHIGHVADRWRDTPDNVGLLAAARAEAEVAAQHAGLAAEAEDLAGVQRHLVHVLHAIDPSTSERGPGAGYGLIRAAEGAAQHIRLAAGSEDASDAVKAHAEHVATSADNVVTWARMIVDMSAKLKAVTDLETAAKMAAEVAAAAEAILNGKDADGDGSVSWGEGEGGLAQAETHLGLMQRAEGIG